MMSQFVVTNTNDSGTGSLREAIDLANQSIDANTIAFNIPGSALPKEIQLLSTLIISNPVTIDGSTQPGSSTNPKIQIKGHVQGSISLMIKNTSNCMINEILFTNNLNNGVIMYSNPQLLITNASSNEIKNCVFHTAVNMRGGCISIQLGSSNNKIYSNYFGTDKTSSKPSLPVWVAVNIGMVSESGDNGQPSGNLIGGTNSTDKNYFYNSQSTGALVGAVSISVAKNNSILNNEFIGNTTLRNIDLFYGGNFEKTSPDITSAVKNGNNLSINGTAAIGDIIEIYLSDANSKDAKVLVARTGPVTSNSWSVSSSAIVGATTIQANDKLIATATDALGNTSEFAASYTNNTVVNTCSFCTANPVITYSPNPVLVNKAITFTNTLSCSGVNTTYSWDFDDPSFGNNSATTANPSHTYTSTGIYFVRCTTTVTQTSTGNSCTKYSIVPINITKELTCESCIGSFAPEQGKYVINAWVKEGNAQPNVTNYTSPEIRILFPTDPNNLSSSSINLSFTPTGNIIDGWQRIEAEFDIPQATYIALQFVSKNSNTNSFFDDVRIFPKNASMISYVYDPVTLKLVAQLDERNYATFFEYDEEGKLTRNKQETEKGIMTIKTNRSNNIKQ